MPLSTCHAPTRRSGLPYGSGRRSTPLTSVKMAIAAASPMTSVVEAVIVNAGARRSDLQAGRRKDEMDMSGCAVGRHPVAYGLPRRRFRGEATAGSISAGHVRRGRELPEKDEFPEPALLALHEGRHSGNSCC